MTSSDDPIRSMLEQATHTLASAGTKASDATAHAQQVLQHLEQVRQHVDHYASFLLLPLCLALLILYEHHRSVTDGGSFRVAQVLARTAAVVAAVLGYSQLCGLICQIGGAGSGWMTSNNYLDLYTTGADSLTTAWDRLGGLGDMPKFIGMVIVWVVLMMSVLFAYVSSALLSVIQAVSLSIFLGLGKVCIVVSLVPGIGLAKSWARSLAQVAAWSTIAGVINGLLSTQNISIGQLLASGQIVELLKASAHFIILALTTLAVPIITAKLFSGGAAGLSEVLPGFLAARGIATGITNRMSGRRYGGPSRGASMPTVSHTAGESARVHKVPFERVERHRAAAPSQAARGVPSGSARSGPLFRRLPLADPGLAETQIRAAPVATSPPPPPRPRRERAEPDTQRDHTIDVTGETA